MFDMLKTIYQGDVLRPHIFGSLGTIAGKNMSARETKQLDSFLSDSGLEIWRSPFVVSRAAELLSGTSACTFATRRLQIVQQRSTAKLEYRANQDYSE
jgi:hypothetical protein